MSRRVWLLLCLAAGLLGLAGYLLWPRPAPAPPRGPAVLWVFEAPHPGGLIAPPTVTDQAVYVSAAHDHGLRSFGAVYALHPQTGAILWAFHRDQAMLPTASAPVVAGDRLFVGEGMHAHFLCHLYCLDQATGRELWAYEAEDHIESTPTVVEGVVYFCAGNAGVCAVAAETGREVWRFTADLHLDSSPWVENGRVLASSGRSRRFQTFQVVSLDARTGAPLWRYPTDLPAWGSPRVANGRVFVGLATGRLNEGAKPPDKPAGAVLALEEATGQFLWRFDTPDAVFQQPRPERDRVYFGSRDGNLYAVRADTGALIYRVPMGGPVIAPPEVADGKIYVVTTGGQLRCLTAADGREEWTFDLVGRTGTTPLVFAAPRVVGGRIYLAAELRTGAGSAATLYCLQP